MPNRFAKRIREGEIDSIESLKSEFKALAKETHPDLAGPEADGSRFAMLRAEYEAALRDFSQHRFSASRRGERKRRSGGGPEGGASPEFGRSGDFPDEAWPRLSLLLDRGFPKRARHEKEELRYEYAFWRLEELLGRGLSSSLRACEAELLLSRATGSALPERALGLLRSLVDYREAGLSAMRTAILLELGAIRSDPESGPGLLGFLSAACASLGLGAEIG